MGDKSGISWTNSTWNPIVGCTRVSRGCDLCYAVRDTRRLAGKLPLYQGLVNPGKGHFNGTVRTVPERLDQPIRWKRPRRIFVNSMSDLFHPSVPFEFIDQVFAVMALAQQHTFQILTKRPERMAAYLNADDVQHRVARCVDQIEVRLEIAALREEWREVPGFPGYRVSNHGRATGPRGELLPDVGEQGHCRVTLFRSGERTRVLLHRLILRVFDREPQGAEQTRHRNGDATCNALPNLCWGSQETNWEDAKRHGSHRRHSKLSPEDVGAIRHRAEGDETASSIAKDYPVSDTQVRNIIRGDQWSTDAGLQWPLPGVWLGTSIEDQSVVEDRIPYLIGTPAAVRFLSVEPLLGPVRLRHIDCRDRVEGLYWIDALTGRNDDMGRPCPDVPSIDWVIVGGESGPGHRPIEADWVREIRDECQDGGVAFFFKQWGGRTAKAGGRLLDGRAHDEYPVPIEGMAT